MSDRIIDFYDKDGTLIRLQPPSELSVYDILKLNGIPSSAVTIENMGMNTNVQFLYNTIFRTTVSLPEVAESVKEDESNPDYYVKEMVVFREDGHVVKKRIHFDKRSFLKNVSERILTKIHEESLIEQGDRILVGFSGGTDCSVMLDIISSNRHKLPDFELVAATVSSLAGTNKAEWITDFLRKRGIKHIWVDDDQIIERFHLKHDISETVRSLLNSKDSEVTINVVQHVIRVMLEYVGRMEKYSKIMLGLEREAMITSILSFYLSGKPINGLFKKSDSEFTYIFPLMAVLKKEEVMYMKEVLVDYSEIPTINREMSQVHNLHKSDWRGLLMLLSGYLLDIIPGIDYYLEHSAKKIIKDFSPLVFKEKCQNCDSSFFSFEDKELSFCGICDLLFRNGLLKWK